MSRLPGEVKGVEFSRCNECPLFKRPGMLARLLARKSKDGVLRYTYCDGAGPDNMVVGGKIDTDYEHRLASLKLFAVEICPRDMTSERSFQSTQIENMLRQRFATAQQEIEGMGTIN